MTHTHYETHFVNPVGLSQYDKLAWFGGIISCFFCILLQIVKIIIFCVYIHVMAGMRVS